MAWTRIGAGFGHTGTMSLKAALEQRGLGPCYPMVECLPRWPPHWQKWVDAAAGKPDGDRIFEGFGSTVDFPSCSSYQALAAHDPQAKIILTARDPERWFESSQATIFAPHAIDYQKEVPMGAFMKATANDCFDGRMHDKAQWIARFEACTRHDLTGHRRAD